MKRADLIEIIEAAQSAMQIVLDNWDHGDLASAIRNMQEVKTTSVDPAIAWWESDD